VQLRSLVIIISLKFLAMKKLLLVLVLFEIILFSNPLFSQQDSVPNVVVTSGQFERVLVVRIKTGNDLLEGLKKSC
jgi:hypothetical protein